MPPLASELRNRLERVIIEARDAAEAGARAALEALAVHEPRSYPHMSRLQQALRNRLRARARQLGDRQDATGRLAIDHLVGECAYEHWHRMLFARFLAENGLLIESQENVAISLTEAEELAKEDGVDVWLFASRCAQRMLPQIFRPEDPLLQVAFATEHRLRLEGLLASLPRAVFTASDALGWVYQFWQSKRKDEVNRSEVKIGADELPAVTQLFTEPYMVSFLLQNTLGAWWAGKELTADDAKSATTEDELRRKLALPGVDWEYLRFVWEGEGRESCEAGSQPAKHGWRPAAGTFDGWPRAAAELKILDPCCGSGHFLVAALHHLVPIRIAEEGLSARDAIDAVLRDNLHGLEIDERCCQIAAFALAFAAWTYPEAGGYRPLPDLHIACTGIGPQATKAQWLELAERAAAKGNMPAKRDLFRKKESLLSSSVANALESLYELFAQAPTLGSLIDPRRLSKDLYQAGYESLTPLLADVFKAEVDDATRERAIAAAGMAKAADLLVRRYTVVTTNVPFLTELKFSVALKGFILAHYPSARADLATTMALRCLALAAPRGCVAIVSPQNWWFLKRYSSLRRLLLQETSLLVLVRLGEKAFRSAQAGGSIAGLTVLEREVSAHDLVFAYDVSGNREADSKSRALKDTQCLSVHQRAWLRNIDSMIAFEQQSGGVPLGTSAGALVGCTTGDASRFIRRYWEIREGDDDWECFQTTSARTEPYGGMSDAILWQHEKGQLAAFAESVRHLNHIAQNWRRGKPSWGRNGVVVSQMGDYHATLYTGAIYDSNCCAIVPKDSRDLAALWAYCSSASFTIEVKKLNQNRKVEVRTFLAVSFDRAHWRTVAAKEYPDGLPEPQSDDPTQWLFHGRPEESDAPLQVAVARLLGYRWPAELDDKMRLSKRARALVKRCDELAEFVDDDGIVCLPSVHGEESAADQLQALLTAAGVEPARMRELTGGVALDDWLRNSFFEEHCKLFHNRPFVWHIWDGRKRDGFQALVNYHKLCEGDGDGRKLLESLTYAYLGEWITRQKDGVVRGEGGAEDRLAAALELQKRLEAILEGDPPCDLFVRWKPLAEQPIGWEPDINDGVRVNIRPFLAKDLPGGRTGAGVLRWKPNIRWRKDRGKEPERPKTKYPWFWGWDEKSDDFAGGKTFDGNRWNGCHYTNKAKQQAREAASKGGR